MSNVFIVGCGRSGTSMTAGLFARSGLFMGDNLHPPSVENQKGYFEDAAINSINNRILARFTPSPINIAGVGYMHDAPGPSGGWLSRIPLSTKISATKDEADKIAEWTSRQPFCFKDTRFSYLLHLWQKNVADPRIICVFRRPELVADSILTNCRRHAGLHDFAISVNQAFEVWLLMYKHILRRQAQSGSWLFVEYDDIASGDAFDRIEAHTSVPLDRTFPDLALNRAHSDLPVPDAAKEIYGELRNFAAASV